MIQNRQDHQQSQAIWNGVGTALLQITNLLTMHNHLINMAVRSAAVSAAAARLGPASINPDSGDPGGQVEVAAHDVSAAAEIIAHYIEIGPTRTR